MSRLSGFAGALLASTAVAALAGSAAFAQDDAYMKEAKAYIEKVTAPVTTWDGPTTGPKAQEGKLVVYASADQRNGGASGVGDGAQEAAEVMGWDFRILDGQGSVPARTSALTQAIALNPDGIDPNFFYGEFLLESDQPAEAIRYLERAVAAPPRPGRRVADAGRREEARQLLQKARERM